MARRRSRKDDLFRSGVYFALFDDDRIKIGQSGNVKDRLRSLAHTLGAECVLFGVIPGYCLSDREAMERAVIRELQPFRKEGREWFALSNASLEKCRSLLVTPPAPYAREKLLS